MAADQQSRPEPDPPLRDLLRWMLVIAPLSFAIGWGLMALYRGVVRRSLFPPDPCGVFVEVFALVLAGLAALVVRRR